jgi:hypothetical protein
MVSVIASLTSAAVAVAAPGAVATTAEEVDSHEPARQPVAEMLVLGASAAPTERGGRAGVESKSAAAVAAAAATMEPAVAVSAVGEAAAAAAKQLEEPRE